MSMAVATREYRAEARFQRVSPQKARLVLELIKGRGVQEALDTAAFTKKRIAPVVHKLLTSAIDNAKYVAGEEGIDLDVDNLYVKNGSGQRRAAHEAHPSRADGAGVPLSAPADAHCAFGGRARGEVGIGDQGGGTGDCAGVREGCQGEEGSTRGREEAVVKKDAEKKTAPKKTAKKSK